MDQEPQLTVWPPAPQGMAPTPQIERNTFKPAPIKWVTWLTVVSVGISFMQSLCDLGLGIDPTASIFVTISAALAKPWNVVPTASLIAFLVWFYRVYKNLMAFETTGLRYSPGWAVGWFFVPIFSIFRPYQMAQTIWKASSPEVDSRDIIAWQSVPGGGIVIGWWTLSIISDVTIFASAIGIHAFKTTNVVTHLASAVSDVSIAAAGVATILLIRAVSARQLAKSTALFAPSGEVA